MLRFLLRRLIGLVLVMAGVSVITFGLAQLVPVDPAATALGQNAREEQIAAYRAELGLDRPVSRQRLAGAPVAVPADGLVNRKTAAAMAASSSWRSSMGCSRPLPG